MRANSAEGAKSRENRLTMPLLRAAGVEREEQAHAHSRELAKVQSVMAQHMKALIPARECLGARRCQGDGRY